MPRAPRVQLVKQEPPEPQVLQAPRVQRDQLVLVQLEKPVQLDLPVPLVLLV